MMWILLSACWLAAGCSSIDDDRTDCGEEEEELQLDYELRLVTNMTTELQTQLTTITEVSVANALKKHLKDIFSDFAHDIDLSFYDTEGDRGVLYHKSDVIDANQTTYTLTLPMNKYMHLAVANLVENAVVSLENEEHSYSSKLHQQEGSALDSHTTGLFTARQPMEVLSGVSQVFNVRLYMANSAVALVLDTKGHQYTDLKVYATGFATQFNISDSVYVYPEASPLIRANKVETENDLLCYCSVNFPSRDAAPAGTDTIWQLKVYLTNLDGSVTETVIDVKEPLKAGDLRIIKASVDDEGAIRPYNSTAGVSVTLDWNHGGTYDPEL